MIKDTIIAVPSITVYLFGAIIVTAMAGFFCAGVTYEKINSRFQYHEIPVVGGGTALIVPEKWSVMPVWDKFGRPHIDTDRECEKPTKKGESP